MSTKGRDVSVKEKRGRSPLLPRKVETGQQVRSPNPPPTLERKKGLASTESRKVPIYSKPTVSSRLYARKPIKQPSFDKSKLVPQSKVMSTKSKFKEKNVTSSYMNITSSTKPKDVGKPRSPLKLKNSMHITEKNVNGKKQMRQSTKGLGSKTMVAEKKPRLLGALSSSKDDHNIVTHEEDDIIIPIVNNDSLIVVDCDKECLDLEDNDILKSKMESEDNSKTPLFEPSVPICLGGDQDISESDTYSQDNVTVDESINVEHIYDHGDEINQQDQADGTYDGSNDRLPHFEVDRENQEVENEQAVQEVDLRSKDVERAKSKDLEHEEMKSIELGHEEPKPKELEIKEGGEEVPKEEDRTLKGAIKDQQVVAQGKKDTAAYNDVIEEAVSKLREQRRNRVKALVGAFETVISLESVVQQK